MYTLIYNTCSYSFPIRMDAYFVYTFKEKQIHKSAYPLHIPVLMITYIYPCLVNENQLFGDAVLVVLLVIPIYLKQNNLYVYNDLYIWSI